MIGLIDTGCANLASVRFALERAGLAYQVAKGPDGLADCDRLILPGVGAAKPAMEQLRARGWETALKAETRPVLGICLGMQLLFERSAEGDVDGLGLIPGRIEKLPPPDDGVWPHMGWNTLDFTPGEEPLLSGLEPGSHVYFVHGFFAPVGSHTRASARYGREISAVVRKGNVAGCQFHPERSGIVGARILTNFATGSV
ncbi:imidazole glycerol phosphate synthase subunit HisH [Maricaulis sp.]|uniref:imidazole glycerol phosphate synthase subunit HisH n=1 Tax=Maricaulis sp. TaxID=1486257 RepID=UPI000C63E7C4|nr:imidazole glycerol phosphate synthase subunit HisH [Maricaulis sp.]MAC89173.1 imidazole glycerol phosphate synthase subunit HisH [Maricaulis sp.]